MPDGEGVSENPSFGRTSFVNGRLITCIMLGIGFHHRIFENIFYCVYFLTKGLIT
jgi:hypothetical protein